MKCETPVFLGTDLVKYIDYGKTVPTGGKITNCGVNVTRNLIMGKKDNVEWMIDEEKGILLIHGTGAIEYQEEWNEVKSKVYDIIIDRGITAIGNNAFKDFVNANRTYIPSTVTSIGKKAFEGCKNLGAFEYQGKTETKCDEQAFEGSELFSVRVSSYYESESFCGLPIGKLYWEFLTKVQWTITTDWKLYIYGKGVVEQDSERHQFPWKKYKENITEIIVKEGITSIANVAFIQMPLVERITFPSTLNQIGFYCFDFNKRMKEIVIPESNRYLRSVNGVMYTKNMTELIYYPMAKEESTIVIPATIKKIRDEALSYTFNIKEIIVEEGNKYYKSVDGVLFSKDMKTIIQYPLGNERSKFIIPFGVTTINDNCFFSSKLETVIFEGHVDLIGHNAFYNNTNLKQVKYYDVKKPKLCGMNAFYKCDNFEKITVAKKYDLDYFCDFRNVTKKLAGGFCGEMVAWNYINNVLRVYGKGPMWDLDVKSIAWSDFKLDIVEIIVDEGITKLGDNAFNGCKNVEKITLPKSLKRQGKNVFTGCDKLNKDDLPKQEL